MPQVRNPLTIDDLIEVFRQVAPEEYTKAIESDDSFALVRAVASMFAEVSKRGLRAAQACYLLKYQTQADSPATSGRFAEFTATMRRTKDEFRGLLVANESMILVGPQGRRYKNVGEYEWTPFETGTKEILFRCEAIGEVGNLDHIADENGELTKQDGSVDTDAVNFANQSHDRTSINASVISGGGAIFSRIQDSGLPDQFTAADVGLYVKIAIGNPNNINRVLRVLGYAEADAPTIDGRLRHSIEVDDGPQRFLVTGAIVEDNSAASFTDQTQQANGMSAGDVDLLPASVGTDDAFYVGGNGGDGPPAGAVFNIATAGVGTWDIVWEYWDGGAWSALPDVLDTTEGFQQSGSRSVTWTVPAGWVQNTVSGITTFFARGRVTTGAPTTTTQPIASNGGVYALHADILTDEADVVTWQMLDWRDLGFELTRIQAATGGRDNDLELLGDERGMYQQSNETDESFSERVSKLPDVVSPNAISRAVNRALRPYGFRGKAIDLEVNGAGEKFDGFYADVDFCDYYEPGDAYPTSPYKLPLSVQEAYGWFFVYLPFFGQEDFGMSTDDGPVTVLESGEYLGPAADSGFTDGYSVPANAVYQSIYETLLRIKLGNIGFTMIRDETLNVGRCP